MLKIFLLYFIHFLIFLLIIFISKMQIIVYATFKCNGKSNNNIKCGFPCLLVLGLDCQTSLLFNFLIFFLFIYIYLTFLHDPMANFTIKQVCFNKSYVKYCVKYFVLSIKVLHVIGCYFLKTFFYLHFFSTLYDMRHSHFNQVNPIYSWLSEAMQSGSIIHGTS